MAMKIFGHRGARGLKPENTIPSFLEGIKSTKAIELDVYCVDGQLVVIHDNTVDRTTNGKGWVMEMTFEELRKLDAGGGAQIPTLQEVLDTVGSDTYVNIELKGVGTAEEVAKVIRAYIRHKSDVGWDSEDFLVSSFNHVELAKFHKLMPDIRIGVLFCGVPVNLAQYAKDMGAYSINLDRDFVTQELVDSAHDLGLNVAVYTVNDQDEANRLKAKGVDGIFTDYPDRIKG
ncbi:MAG: glycerophosphodiester phosphodiesterase family protein [Patescibacteria group bacterium]